MPSYYFIPFFYYFAPFLLVWSISYLHPCGYTLNTWTDNICYMRPYSASKCWFFLVYRNFCWSNPFCIPWFPRITPLFLPQKAPFLSCTRSCSETCLIFLDVYILCIFLDYSFSRRIAHHHHSCFHISRSSLSSTNVLLAIVMGHNYRNDDRKVVRTSVGQMKKWKLWNGPVKIEPWPWFTHDFGASLGGWMVPVWSKECGCKI